jgi:hypothetical protein
LPLLRHSGEGLNPVKYAMRSTQHQKCASHGVLKLDSGLRRNDGLKIAIDG